MNKDFVLKTLRLFIGVLVFVSLTQMFGMEQRMAQEIFLQLAILVIFGLLLGNIWLTLFLWLTVLLFTLYGFKSGGNYVANIGFGCLLYYLTKIAFKKEHIDQYLSIYLWLIAGSVGLMVLQVIGFDFIYMTRMLGPSCNGEMVQTCEPASFFGFKACMGMVMAFGVPILLSRWNLAAKIGACLLFVPIYISSSSVAVVGAILGALFVLWYRINWKWFVGILLVLIALGSLYVVKVDMPMGMMGTRPAQWKTTLSDAKIHPITGWGLDSFRQRLPWKPHVYVMNFQEYEGQIHAQYWDNPHSLYVSLAFEWGFLSLFLLGGYIRQLALWFKNCLKDRNSLALMGFVIVFFIVNIAQFPLFLARCAAFCIPLLALAEVQIRE